VSRTVPPLAVRLFLLCCPPDPLPVLFDTDFLGLDFVGDAMSAFRRAVLVPLGVPAVSLVTISSFPSSPCRITGRSPLPIRRRGFGVSPDIDEEDEEEGEELGRMLLPLLEPGSLEECRRALRSPLGSEEEENSSEVSPSSSSSSSLSEYSVAVNSAASLNESVFIHALGCDRRDRVYNSSYIQVKQVVSVLHDGVNIEEWSWGYCSVVECGVPYCGWW